jgi:hypothetical protein
VLPEIDRPAQKSIIVSMLVFCVNTFRSPGVKRSDRRHPRDHHKSQPEAYFMRDSISSTPGDFAIAAVRALGQSTFRPIESNTSPVCS